MYGDLLRGMNRPNFGSDILVPASNLRHIDRQLSRTVKTLATSDSESAPRLVL